jgi:hypothetical protein
MRPSLITGLAAAALGTAAAPASARAADAVYGGNANGATIVVRADAKATELRSFGMTWTARCSDGTRFPGGAVLTPVTPEAGFSPTPDELLRSRNAKGRFSGTQLTGGDGVAINVQVDGKLKASAARGTLRATVKIFDPATGNAVTSCTASQSWAATRKAGTIYGGATSKGVPIVVRLNAQRNRISDVLTMWSATCTTGGFFAVPAHFGNFAIKSTGAFGSPFADDEPFEAGGKLHAAFDFAGRLTSKAIKGTLQVKVTTTDAAGAPIDACDSGAVRWKATTG